MSRVVYVWRGAVSLEPLQTFKKEMGSKTFSASIWMSTWRGIILS